MLFKGLDDSRQELKTPEDRKPEDIKKVEGKKENIKKMSKSINSEKLKLYLSIANWTGIIIIICIIGYLIVKGISIYIS